LSIHLLKSTNSKEASEYLKEKNPYYRDWEVITLFYSALHLVERYCEVHSIPIPKNHKSREDVVVGWLKDISVDYLNLYQLSKNARYESLIKNDQLLDAQAYYSTIEFFIKKQS